MSHPLLGAIIGEVGTCFLPLLCALEEDQESNICSAVLKTQMGQLRAGTRSLDGKGGEDPREAVIFILKVHSTNSLFPTAKKHLSVISSSTKNPVFLLQKANLNFSSGNMEEAFMTEFSNCSSLEEQVDL